MQRFAVLLLSIVSLIGTRIPANGGQPTTKEESDKLVMAGNAFLGTGQFGAALASYRQAAKVGNVEGIFATGDFLFTQGQAGSGQKRIVDLAEGLGYLFRAATNNHPKACAELAFALQNGIGLQTNLIQAYAWQKLAVQHDRAFKADLDRLIIRLEPGEVDQAQQLAHEYSLGHWPADLVHPVEQGDPRLKIQGLALRGGGTLVILNGVTFGVRDTVSIKPANSQKRTAGGERLTVTCLEIGTDYALCAIAGDPAFKLIPAGRFSR